jgi:hypothetical protein
LVRAGANSLLRLAGAGDNANVRRFSAGHQPPLRLLDVGRSDDGAGRMETKMEKMQMSDSWDGCLWGWMVVFVSTCCCLIHVISVRKVQKRLV